MQSNGQSVQFVCGKPKGDGPCASPSFSISLPVLLGGQRVVVTVSSLEEGSGTILTNQIGGDLIACDMD